MTLAAAVAARAASALEQGALQGGAARALSAIWAARSRVCRSVVLPPGTAVVGVGGATLGGSCKTPLVLALARALALAGEGVAVVGHGYRGRGRGPRRARPGDDVRDVGDEALQLARELAAFGVPVVVGPREGALALASTLAPRLIVDGLLQAAPERLALSVLAVDAEHPLGAGRCPPAGDLRARPSALLEATDVVARVGASVGDGLAGSFPPTRDGASRAALPGAPVVLAVGAHLGGARDPSGALVPLARLRGERVGLIVAIARPERVLRSLHEHGIFPAMTRTFLDHSRPAVPDRPDLGGVSAWLTTGKCRTKLGPELQGSPVLVLEHRLDVPKELVERVREARPRPLSRGKDPW